MAPSRKPVHLSGYQARDYDVVDYHMYELGETGLKFRGPEPQLAPGSYFTCIGAAQTFGCFCPTPFPELLARNLQIPVLNLGYGGAGPEFYCRTPQLLEYVNRGQFAVIQVMSGRSQSNSLFDSGGLEYLTRRSNGESVGANEAYRHLLEGNSLIRTIPPKKLGHYLARLLAFPMSRKIISETRFNWIQSYRTLLDQITVPKILFWFSKRAPGYRESYKSVNGLFGEFPQLVNEEMIHAIKNKSDYYVECITRRGSPQPLFSRFTGQPVCVNPEMDRPDLGGGNLWTHNRYYPSPEMQEDAAATLYIVVGKLLSSPSRAVA